MRHNYFIECLSNLEWELSNYVYFLRSEIQESWEIKKISENITYFGKQFGAKNKVSLVVYFKQLFVMTLTPCVIVITKKVGASAKKIKPKYNQAHTLLCYSREILLTSLETFKLKYKKYFPNNTFWYLTDVL